MKSFIFGDVETTGLGADAGIVEIAWVETDASLNVICEHHSLINPQKPIQYGAMGVHGITNDMVKDSPTIEEFMAQHGESLLGKNKILCSHNVSFDQAYFVPWMSTPETLCSLKCARILYPDADNHKLATLRCMLNLEGDHEKAHSAREDVAVLMRLIKRMCVDNRCEPVDLLEVQTRKRAIKVMPFGKHKGTPLKDLPDQYIWWLLNKAENLDADLRASLEAL